MLDEPTNHLDFEALDWLEEELLPEAGGDFRLGRDLLERKLRYEEHLPLTVSELSVMNERAIRDYRERLAFTAKKISRCGSARLSAAAA